MWIATAIKRILRFSVNGFTIQQVKSFAFCRNICPFDDCRNVYDSEDSYCDVVYEIKRSGLLIPT
jgi:hypothetical protein